MSNSNNLRYEVKSGGCLNKGLTIKLSKYNMLNTRREFFNVTLKEIEEVVNTNYGKTVDFVKNTDDEQYRSSLIIKGACK